MQFLKIKSASSIILLLVLVLSPMVGIGQSYKIVSFTETHPENNIDSLENWLNTHPEPNQQRFINLVKLIRTYEFQGISQTYEQVDEIALLSKKNNIKWGEIFAQYKRNSPESYKHLLNLKKEFEARQDAEGLVFAMSRLIIAHYDGTGIEIGNKNLTNIYRSQIENLLKGKSITYSHVEYWWAEYISTHGKEDSDTKYVNDFMEKVVNNISSNPKLGYSLIKFSGGLAVTYYYLKKYLKSYELNKWILTKLNNRFIHSRILYTQNLGNDCEFLGKYEERIRLNQEVIHLIKKHFPSNLQTLNNAYISLKEEMYRKGLYKEASLYADSVIVLQDSLYTQNHRKDLLELQTQLEVQEKENEINELNLQKEYVKKQNQLYLLVLAIGSIALCAVVFLVLRLRSTNQHLKQLDETRERFIQILTHDLRRPLHSFMGMADILSKLIKKGNYESINKIASSIDESGTRTLQLLDNTLYWAISKKNKVMNEPTTFSVIDHLAEVIRLYEAVGSQKNIGFNINFDIEHSAFTNPDAFDLVIRNLIDNAIKYSTTNSTIHIDVTTNKEFIKISISNDGYITPEKINLIQQIIKTPHKAYPKQQGIGIGIIIMSTFVQQNNLKLSVSSSEQFGTIFSLTVPMA